MDHAQISTVRVYFWWQYFDDPSNWTHFSQHYHRPYVDAHQDMFEIRPISVYSLPTAIMQQQHHRSVVRNTNRNSTCAPPGHVARRRVQMQIPSINRRAYSASSIRYRNVVVCQDLYVVVMALVLRVINVYYRNLTMIITSMIRVSCNNNNNKWSTEIYLTPLHLRIHCFFCIWPHNSRPKIPINVWIEG